MDPTQNPVVPVDPNAGVQTPSVEPVMPSAEPVVPAVPEPAPVMPEPQAPVEQPTPVMPTEGTGDAGTGVPPTTPPAAI